MSLPPEGPIFLERAAYRRRRLQDAARLLPMATIILLLMPVWLMPSALSGALGMVGLFAVWLLIVIASGLLHRRLGRPLPTEAPKDEL